MLSGRGVAAVLSLVYLGIVTRMLGPAGFGTFALILGVAQTIAAFVSFQVWQVVVRYGMGHLREGRHAALARLLKACFALDYGAAAFGCLIAAIGMPFAADAFGWAPELHWQALGVACGILLSARSALLGLFRLHDRFAQATAIDLVVPVVRLVGTGVAALVAPTLTVFLYVWVASELLASVTYWVKARPLLHGLGWRDAPLRSGLLREENPGFWRMALVTNASQTFALASRQGAVLLVGLVAGTLAAGRFRVAHQLGQALAKVGQMLSRALFPELVRAHATIEPHAFRRLVLRTAGASALAGVVIVLLLLVIGRPALALIAGPGFAAAYPLLVILGAAAVVDLVAVAFEPALYAVGRENVALTIQASVAVTMVCLMLLLLHLYGTIGGAVAMLCGSLLNVCVMGLAVSRTLRRH
nr:lipopolysaccharide biosynthesis protein [Sphingomonas sp. ID1715]